VVPFFVDDVGRVVLWCEDVSTLEFSVDFGSVTIGWLKRRKEVDTHVNKRAPFIAGNFWESGLLAGAVPIRDNSDGTGGVVSESTIISIFIGRSFRFETFY